MEEKIWSNIAEVLLDFFDVDIQLSYVRIIEKLKDTPNGERLSAWARANPMPFEALIRLLSMAVNKVPKNKNILTQTIADHIRRLPREIRGSLLGYSNGSNHHQTGSNKTIPTDEAFQKRYSDALEGLSEDELVQIIGLNRNQLIEWVNTPKQLRPHLLKKWRNASSEKSSNNSDTNTVYNLMKYTSGRRWEERRENFSANKKAFRDSKNREK
jgi:hypothetical protein